MESKNENESEYPDLNQNLITFGKFVGKNLSELLRDRNYCRWLEKQLWFENYKYLYKIVSTYDPRSFFINPKFSETDHTKLSKDDFVDCYIYFNLNKIDETLRSKLTETDLISYSFYLGLLEDLKKKIKVRIANEDENPFDITAPSKWLNKFETETKLSRDVFKEFLNAYDLPNLTTVVEEIKAFGGLEYKGGQSYKISKERSKSQENFWELLLHEKYKDKISSQFKYLNCIFDFIHINSNTLYECKLNLKDFEKQQYEKYLKVTKDCYNMKYLISRDCVIDMDLETIYTTNIKEYLFYQLNIPLLPNPSIFDEIIFDFDLVEVVNFDEVL